MYGTYDILIRDISLSIWSQYERSLDDRDDGVARSLKSADAPARYILSFDIHLTARSRCLSSLVVQQSHSLWQTKLTRVNDRSYNNYTCRPKRGRTFLLAGAPRPISLCLN